MNILVTGGAGFIGTSVVEQAIASGHAVTVFDNLETGDRANLPPGVPLIEGDIRDPEALKAAMAGIEVVIHLAAMVSVVRSVREPQACFDTNVTGTHNVLAAAREARCRRVVYASSAAVYGNAAQLPKRETHTPEPASPYALSKTMNEVHAEYFSKYMGLETVGLRFFNVYGPRQRPDSPYAGVISVAASRLLAGETFTVNGTGEQTRDFVYVDDIAGATLAAATRPGLALAVVNVGSGTRLSLLALLAAMGRTLEVTPQLAFGPPREGDVLHSQADISRLVEELGYRPQVSLEEGLKRTLGWMKTPTGTRT